MPSASAPNSVLRNLPSVDEVLRSETGSAIISAAGERHAAVLARAVIAELRSEISSDPSSELSKYDLLCNAESKLSEAWRLERLAGSHRVINATGVVIHTNLGRAPLSENARMAIADAAGYCTLEYDINTGKRGRRGQRAEELLAELTGAESVLIVNNCAAAAFFVLTGFGFGGEVIISRGEMVEIGGDFRVPDVLTQSGAVLREVGTTNRTKLADYEKAINEQTRVILRVHPSNYRIVGFTSMPGLDELADLAHRSGIVLYEDIGSGALIDLSGLGLTDEPQVNVSIAAGVDIVTFSGDKLLGGPQSGIIAGKAEYIERLRKHPLYRALRVDKLTYAALEATLEVYRRGSEADDVPVLRMLSMTKAEIRERAERFVNSAVAASEDPRDSASQISDLKFEIVDGVSAVGGGAAPNVTPETALIAVSHTHLSASRLEFALRNAPTPIITRIVDDRVMIDLRTVGEGEEAELAAALLSV
ncbi:MAG TPA: L-seryl-tRNA(Sec) selenium transferase [Pyrinomonadaceae bacterium]|nr:L-seryl-tRNA(Sec) selenium transferase [Acidobacteriota bacterium]HQZ96109.1 L-seryl-tRNA(Sec) selenium transferase [Pyrinomonadaceae bacterium]